MRNLIDMSRIPIVIIMGATGTGKSKLAVQIAKKFQGEIISADSMQVYEGLDIMSNKITAPEREGIPHHLLDICRPTDNFSVLDFRNRALLIIEDILNRRKLPIITGGTTYYIDSILYKMLVENPQDSSNELTFQRRRILIDKKKSYRQKLRSNEISDGGSSTNEDNIDEINLENLPYMHKKAVDPTDNCSIIDQLANGILQIGNEFGKSISYIVNELLLHYSHYQRTFYPMSDISNQGETDLNMENDYEKIKELSTEIAVELEKKLLYEFINLILKDVICHLDRIENSMNANELPNCTESCDIIIREIISNIDIASIWNRKHTSNILTSFEEKLESLSLLSDEKEIENKIEILREFCKNCNCKKENIKLRICQNLMNEICNEINKIVDIRSKRLRLLRIMDDTNMSDFSNNELYSELRLLDKKTANTLHPNDRRKVMRAIQLFMTTGKTPHVLRKEQHMMYNVDVKDNVLDENALPLRYPNAIVIWLYCDQDVLDDRLTKRVDEMIEDGLIAELERFHEQYNLERLNTIGKPDYSKGIFQSIGLKEFHSYLMLSPEEKESKSGQKQLNIAVRRLKTANIQYSKSQNRYISNKFVKVPNYKQVPLLFKLDCTNLDKWHEEVESKALILIDAYLNKETENGSFPYPPVERESADLDRFSHGEFFCELCQRLFTSKYQFQIHIASKGHRKCLYSRKVRELQRKMMAIKRPSPDVRVSSPKDDEWNNFLWDKCNS